MPPSARIQVHAKQQNRGAQREAQPALALHVLEWDFRVGVITNRAMLTILSPIPGSATFRYEVEAIRSETQAPGVRACSIGEQSSRDRAELSSPTNALVHQPVSPLIFLTVCVLLSQPDLDRTGGFFAAR